MSIAQYDDHIILKTLDVKLLPTSGEDCGWDIFQLHYSTGGPLETVCTYQMKTFMKPYLRSFFISHTHSYVIIIF